MNAFERRVDITAQTPETPQNTIVSNTRKGIAAFAATIALAGGVQASENLPTLDVSQFQEGVRTTVCVDGIGSFVVEREGGELYRIKSDYKGNISKLPIAQYIEETMKALKNSADKRQKLHDGAFNTENGRMTLIALAETNAQFGDPTPQGTCPKPIASN